MRTTATHNQQQQQQRHRHRPNKKLGKKPSKKPREPWPWRDETRKSGNETSSSDRISSSNAVFIFNCVRDERATTVDRIQKEDQGKLGPIR